MLFSLLLLVFIGCEKKNSLLHPVDCSSNLALEGTWRLSAYQNLDNGTLQPDPDPKGRGVVFTFSEDSISVSFKGHTVVNSVSGGYSKGAECKLENGIFGGTKVGEPTQWSNKVWSAMNSVGNYGQTQKNLFIYFNQKSEVMIFSKIK